MPCAGVSAETLAHGANLQGWQAPAQIGANLQGWQAPAQIGASSQGWQAPAQIGANLQGWQAPAQIGANLQGWQALAQIGANLRGLQPRAGIGASASGPSPGPRASSRCHPVPVGTSPSNHGPRLLGDVGLAYVAATVGHGCSATSSRARWGTCPRAR